MTPSPKVQGREYQRQKEINLIYLLTILSLFVSQISFAKDSDYLLEVEQSLENRMSSIVKTVDAKAIVIVHVEQKTAEFKVPETPFIVPSMPIQDNYGNANLSKIEVTILTSMDQLPEDISTLLKNSTKRYKIKPTISLKKLTSENIKDEEITFAGKLRKQVEDRLTLAAIAGGTIFIFVALSLALVLMLRNGSKQLENVVAGFQKLAGAVENSGGMGGSNNTPQPVHDRGMPLSGESGSGGAKALSLYEDITDDGLIALLSDCYWCEIDSYASFLWKNIPQARKRTLLTKWPVLEEYSEYIISLPSMNLALENESAYLNPAPTYPLDKRAMTEIVKKYPGILHKLSSIRKANLNFTAKERIEITKKALTLESKSEPEWKNQIASAKRKLKKQLIINISNNEEELEVLNLPNLSEEMKENIPSLGWLSKLEPDTIRSILEDYSPKDLASVWVGPEEVLSVLLQAIPEKKRELLQFYLAKTKPRRDLPLFYTLHKRALEKKEDVPNASKAA